MPKHLEWRIKEIALAKGLLTPWKLHKYLFDLKWVNPPGAATCQRLWNNEIKLTTVENIRRFCVAFDQAPPGVFRWSDDPLLPWHNEMQEHPYLVWRVRELAEKKELTQIRFAQAARLFYSTRADSKDFGAGDLIWSGEQQSIKLETLGRIVQLLNVDIGGLFQWVE